MRKIQKHEFEPVSLLTVEDGMLELAIIPTKHQPNWLVPKSLILTIEPYSERIWTYIWSNPQKNTIQEVAVYHLIDRQTSPDKLVILEGNTNVHRLALQTTGDIRYTRARISDVRDIELPDDIQEHMKAFIPSLLDNPDEPLDFMYQAVIMDDVVYIVPDLDLIAHRLVDLDS